MNMRESFVQTTKELIRSDKKVGLILAGISVAGFTDEIKDFPERVFDAGISEQANINIAAGMSITGMIPVFHSFAPFISERAYEQLKIGFGYQNIGGNFISTGSSLDCSSFGATHQCPAEIGILKEIPNFQIIVPGTAEEFRKLYLETYNNNCPTYIRTSREQNSKSYPVRFGKANMIKTGSELTIIAVGNMLQMVLDAVGDLDVTILYYTTVQPFDAELFKAYKGKNNKVLLCEPYYKGALLYDIIEAASGMLQIEMVGIPHEFCKYYGLTTECYKYMGITASDIRAKAVKLIEGR